MTEDNYLDPKKNPMIPVSHDAEDYQVTADNALVPLAARAGAIEALAERLLGCADARIDDDVRIDRDANGWITVNRKSLAELSDDEIETLRSLKVPEE